MQPNKSGQILHNLERRQDADGEKDATNLLHEDVLGHGIYEHSQLGGAPPRMPEGTPAGERITITTRRKPRFRQKEKSLKPEVEERIATAKQTRVNEVLGELGYLAVATEDQDNTDTGVAQPAQPDPNAPQLAHYHSEAEYNQNTGWVESTHHYQDLNPQQANPHSR